MAATVFNSAFRLVVILIGRLRLSPSRAIEAYIRLARVIPTQVAKSEEEKKSNTETFKTVFIEVLKEAGFDQNTPMLDEDGAKMYAIIFNPIFPSINRSNQRFVCLGYLKPFVRSSNTLILDSQCTNGSMHYIGSSVRLHCIP
jgi:hypothetical protein